MSSDQDRAAHSFGYILKQAQHILRIHMDEALKPLGLTTPQYAVLSQLESCPGISNAALARASFLTPQTMHGIVLNLEKRDFVRREQDPHHGRILSATLTEQGREAVSKAHKLVEDVEAKMMGTLNQETQDYLRTLLTECTENLR